MILRRARRDDVPAIVALFQDDFLGAGREVPKGAPLPESYYAAFDEIDADPRCELVVAEEDGRVVGTMQATLLTHLGSRGAKSLQLENVHVSAALRSRGIGEAHDRMGDRARARRRAAPASSSRRTSSARTRTGSTSGSASPRRTRA